jgi:hypothetical protein
MERMSPFQESRSANFDVLYGGKKTMCAFYLLSIGLLKFIFGSKWALRLVISTVPASWWMWAVAGPVDENLTSV